MKVLLSAYACEPSQGSESGLGWGWAEQAARFNEVWVMTLGEQRQAIERTLSLHPLSNAHFVYLDLPRSKEICGPGRLGRHIFYHLWQIAAYFVGRELHRRERFDLVHHVTFGCYWRPSLLALLPAPFIWGPVGGGESAPDTFRPCFSPRGKLYEILRDIARKVGECDPFVRRTARRARIGLATTEESASRMRILGCPVVSLLSQVGLPEKEIVQLGTFTFRHSNPFRVVSIGRLLHWKGFDLGLRGFARLRSLFPATEYWIIGDGPERDRLSTLAGSLGVAEAVTFWGAIPRQEALEKLAECDVLLHPSLHDSNPTVCLEAMAAGRPVICLDLGGPALQVTNETGIKVPAISPENAATCLAQALSRLASDSALRVRLGQSGRQRVKEHFGWDEKGRFLAALYADVARNTS